jgi:hypothetical protein
MLVKAFKSNREININVSKYRIDWNRKVSKPQFKFKKFVYPYWKFDVVLEEFVIPKSGGKRIDLFNISKGIAVEISPASVHFEYNKFFHGSEEGYGKKIRSDLDKIDWIESNGWKILEIVDEDLQDENLNREYLIKKYGIKF